MNFSEYHGRFLTRTGYHLPEREFEILFQKTIDLHEGLGIQTDPYHVLDTWTEWWEDAQTRLHRMKTGWGDEDREMYGPFEAYLCRIYMEPRLWLTFHALADKEAKEPSRNTHVAVLSYSSKDPDMFFGTSEQNAREAMMYWILNTYGAESAMEEERFEAAVLKAENGVDVTDEMTVSWFGEAELTNTLVTQTCTFTVVDIPIL